MGTDEAVREANDDLVNWGRAYTDIHWMNEHLLHAIPQTSEEYRAPTVVYDESPEWGPIDEIWAERVNEWVQQLFTDDIESYRVIQHWYTKVIFMTIGGQAIPREDRIKRLSRHMKTGYRGAVRMLEAAQRRYWQKRLRRAV